MLTFPAALLLDFGGVLADAPRQRSAPAHLVQRLHDLVEGVVPADQIAQDLTAGDRAYASWRDEVSEEDRPVELTHAELWGRFVAGEWPPPARDAVLREAGALSYAWAVRPDWAVRDGMPEALDAAVTAGLALAVVSNTLCGAAHRDFLTKAGLGDRFAVQLYSDEVGVRKPNPELAWRAAEALGVPIGQCWFVGDSLLRDVLCARRAGVGAAVLMRSPRTNRDPMTAGEVTPDLVVDDGYGLRDLIAGADPAI